VTEQFTKETGIAVLSAPGNQRPGTQRQHGPNPRV
jgi:hypothetical protein